MKHLGFALGLLIAASQTPVAAWAADAAQAARYYEDALSRYEKNDHAGAIVQLKNALQQDPNYLSAYLLLGQAQLQRGDLSGAELSLSTALRMGADRAELTPPLTEAYMRQGKYKELLEQLHTTGLPLSAALDLWLKRAYAQMATGDLSAAGREIDRAANLASASADVAVARGMLQLQKGDLAAASQFADQALHAATDNTHAWNLRASVDHARGNAKAALAGYDRALVLQPGFVDVQVARAGLLFDLNRPEEAYKDLTHLKERHPQEPRAAYLRSIYFSRKGDAAAAKAELLQAAKTVEALPPAYLAGKPQLLMVGALANHGLRAFEQARGFAERYIRLKPGDAGARKLLGSILLTQGSSDAAITHLLQAFRAAPQDPEILNMLASAYMARSQYAKAANLLEQAGPMVMQKPLLSSTLGFSLIGLGREEEGMEYLSQAFAKNPADFRLGNGLVMFHLQRGEPKTAVRVAEAFLGKHGKDPSAYNLLGVAKAGNRDYKGARAAYDKALALAPHFHVARLNLAKLETALGNLDAARLQLQTILKVQTKHAQAQYELGLVELAAGRPNEALRWLQAALTRAPRNPVIAVRLIDTLLALGQADKALAQAKQASALAPDDFEIASALGRAHAALGQTSRAQATFANMSKLAGFNIPQLESTARLQLALGDLSGTNLSLNKALGDQPGAIEANLLMAELERRKGQTTQALERAKQIATANPTSALAQSGLGDALMATGSYAPAVQAYRSALAVDDSADNALRYHSALSASGNAQQALAFMEDWSQRHPHASNAKIALGEAQLKARLLTQARATYEAYLKYHGDHPIVLNNLANILMKQGDANALMLAERAYKLAPEAAPVNDTLGWLLMGQGQTDRALRHLREARLRAPDDREIRYHLAATLHRAGRNKEAMQELEQALRGSESFTEMDAARQLKEKLSNR